MHFIAARFCSDFFQDSVGRLNFTLTSDMLFSVLKLQVDKATHLIKVKAFLVHPAIE